MNKPKGFKSYVTNVGIKNDTEDFVVVLSEIPAAAAAVFTKNDFVGEPIKIGREHIKDGILQAIVINSKNANVATGEQGHMDALAICEAIARKFCIERKEVFPSSTGVIGVKLPIKKILAGIRNMPDNLPDFNIKDIATGIMTTDRYPKFITRRVGEAVIAGVAKGAGMIEPNMATMLSFFFTDAALPSGLLDKALKRAVDRSFNCLTIDSDTSTSDTAAIMANGLAGPVDEAEFETTLSEMCIHLTKEIARNGEGVTKLIEVEIVNAISEEQAKIIAKTVANSPLVKTAIYGCDANWGRIAAAAGKCNQGINPAKMNIYLGIRPVFYHGKPVAFDEEILKKYLSGTDIRILVDLNQGKEKSMVWTGDFTEGYIKENASYRS